jgi:accessory secretory protein Asp1
MLQTYYTAKKEHKLLEKQQKAFEAARKQVVGFKKIDDAFHFMDNVSYRYQSDTPELDQDLRFTRVFIDDRVQSDLFMQSRVVGAGIPIISREPSIYFSDGENGALIENDEALFNSLSTYLQGSREWNQALVASIDKINANGTDQLIESWRGILHGQKE